MDVTLDDFDVVILGNDGISNDDTVQSCLVITVSHESIDG